MRNVTGAVAEGKDFFNRVSEIAAYWRNLETDSLLLLAPRRVGKTSVMLKMREDAASHGFTTVYADVSDASDELHFVQRLYTEILNQDQADGLWTQVKNSWLGQQLERVQKIGGGGFTLEFRQGGPDWTRLGEELVGALSKLEDRWLIQIDELPVFVLKLLNHDEQPDRVRVREFLYWMRRLRQQYTRVRWMLAGSIGLNTVTARLNIADSINDLRLETLGDFDEPTAEALLIALSETHGVQLGEAARKHIVVRAGWLAPYYLQLIFHELRGIDHPVTEADVDLVVEDLLGPHHRNYFDYWRQRLHEELGRQDADCAITLLNHCCRASEGATRSTLSLVLSRAIQDAAAREDKLRYLLDVFQNDGYLIADQDRWRFRSPLLREFWVRRVAPPEPAQ